MSLIKKINEDAAGGAVGGGAVAAFAMPLFTSIVQSEKPVPKAKVIKYGKKKKKPTIGLGEAYRTLMELDPNAAESNAADTGSSTPHFDVSSVISKLKSLEQKEKTDTRDTVVFGLEDDKGGLVRVTVKNEQAPEFEKALQSFMADTDEDEGLPEIAEVLFKLKDHFDIVNVEWPEVEEDEEQEQGVEPGAGEEGVPGEGELGDLGAPGEGELGDLGAAPGGAGTDEVKDLLTQVIDMMKADADARKAEARAKEAEAKAKEADIAQKQLMTKVKQEEQMLDMDAYNKAQKESDKETKRLASLARWKSEMEQGGGEAEPLGDIGLPTAGAAPEEEEMHSKVRVAKPQQNITKGGRVHPHDIANFLLKRIK